MYILTVQFFHTAISSVQFSSVIQSCQTLCDPMNHSTPGLPVHHKLPEFTQTHVHWLGDAIQPSHPLSSPSPSAFDLSQHQGLFKWVSSLHEVAKVLEFQLQHQTAIGIYIYMCVCVCVCVCTRVCEELKFNLYRSMIICSLIIIVTPASNNSETY